MVLKIVVGCVVQNNGSVTSFHPLKHAQITDGPSGELTLLWCPSIETCITRHNLDTPAEMIRIMPDASQWGFVFACNGFFFIYLFLGGFTS